uniref:INO80 complex subunit E n=1 Tax=Strongyloides stercoralis TaxID=6248 RepID=A0A0K0DVG8_STRER
MNENEKLLLANLKPLPSPSIFFMNSSKNSSLSALSLTMQPINSTTSDAPQIQQQILPQYQIEKSTHFVNNSFSSSHYHSPKTGISNTIKLQKPIIINSSTQKVNNQSENIFQTSINNQINNQTEYLIPLNCSESKNDLIENSSLQNKLTNKLFFDSICYQMNPKKEYRELKKKFKLLVYENEYYQEELRNHQKKLLKLSKDKNFLLDRLIQYEKCLESSDDSDCSIKTTEDKSFKGKTIKKNKKYKYIEKEFYLVNSK